MSVDGDFGDEPSEPIDRLVIALRAYVRKAPKKRKKGSKQVAELLGLTGPYIGRVLSGEKPMTEEVAAKVEKAREIAVWSRQLGGSPDVWPDDFASAQSEYGALGCGEGFEINGLRSKGRKQCDTAIALRAAYVMSRLGGEPISERRPPPTPGRTAG